MAALPAITPEIIKKYQDEIAKASSESTAKRKTASLNRFFGWAEDQGHIDASPMPPPPQNSVADYVITTAKPVRGMGLKTWAILGTTLGIIILIFLLTWKLGSPITFIKNFAAGVNNNPTAEITINNQNVLPSTVPASTIPVTPAENKAWNLFAKIKISDIKGEPKVGSQTLTFKLFNSESGGTPLWTSDPKNITTNSEGSALISLDGVPADLFFQNNNLFLEPITSSSSGTTRIPIPTASDPGTPAIAADGNLVLAGESPSVAAKDGDLLIEGQTVTIKTTDGGGGNIEINPDANGYAHFFFEGNKGNFLNAQGPNLTSGSLYYGMVPNNATGYDLIRLQSGSPKMTTKFSVDALGNTYIAGNENVAGNIATNGTDRLTSSGALQNITGYSQNSGNFVITQNPGDFGSIVKSGGTALNDVLTLTLDERGVTTNTNYSTLVLNRYNAYGNGMALRVANGNAQFDGQVKLGNYSSNPTSIGTGSLVYNTTDNLVYFWNGTTWTVMGSGGGGSSAFNDITSGTNTTAAMIVDTGASLTFSGTGTINASDVTCVGCVSNAELANSAITINSSGILSGGGTVSLGGTLNLTATEADTLDSVTNRGATTLNAITVGNLTDSGLTANKGVFTDALKQLTSTGTLGADQGGTGFSSYTVGDLLYADTATTLARLNDVATGNVLISGGIGVIPSWGKIVLGTHTTGNYVSSIAGTTNQITASAPTGDVTLSIPSDFRAPGTVNAVNGLYTGATAGTQRIDASGNLVNIGTTQLNGVTYTWPGSATAGYILQSGSTGTSSTLSWVDPASAVAATVPWLQGAGVLYPKSSSTDVLIGSDATVSAKFAFKNVLTGVPTASISGNIANVATFIDGNGNISTTNRQNLVLGNSATYDTTGNILLNPNGTGNVGIGDATPLAALTVGNGDLFQVDGATGNITTTGDIAVNGGDITTSAANLVLGANGALTGNIQIGSLTPSTTPDLLVVDKKSDAGNPSGSTGAIYLNSSDKLMVNEATVWKEICNKTDQGCGTGSGSAWSALTAPIGNLSLSMAAYTTAFDWTATGAINPWTMSLNNNAGSATTQNFVTLTNAVTSQTADVNTESLLLLDNADTSGTGSTVVDNAILITNSGSIAGGITDAVDASAVGITNAINIGGNNIAGTNFNVTGGTGQITTAGNAAINGGSLTTTATTANLFTGATTLLNIGPASNVGSLTLSGGSADTGCTLDGVTGNLTCSGDITSTATTGTQGFWTQNLGALYPTNNSVDLLIGASATTSAKFAFKNVLTGTPTASISGTTASVATYLTGEGNLATTNAANLTLGGSTTGNVIINSRGFAALTANGADLIGTGTFTFPNTNTLTGVANYLQFSQGISVGGATTYHFDSSGNIVANDVAANGGNLTTTSVGTATVFNTNATTLNIGGGATTTINVGPTGSAGSIALSGGSADTGCTLDGTTGNLTCSGNITTTATTGTQGWWQRIAGNLSPINLNDTISATTSAAVALTLTQTGPFNALLVEDQASDPTPFVIDQSGNVGIGTTAPTAKLDVAGAASVSGSLTFRTGASSIQTTAGNPLTIGGDTTGNITLNPSNAIAGGFVAPNTTNVSDLGTASLLWRNIYGTKLYQGVNQVCDAGGAVPGCGSGGSSNWTQDALGVLYPNSQTTDVLIGGVATSSAKFAFKNILTGTPTMDVSLQATNIAVKDNTTNALQILEGANPYLAINTNNTTENMSFGNTTTNPTFSFLGSGNTTMGGDLAVNGATSADITSTTNTATIFNSNVISLSLGGAATTLNIGPTGSGATSIVFSGGSGDTGCTLNGSSGALTCSGDITTTAASGTQGWWQLIGSDLSPTSTSYNLAVGGTNSTSPFYVAGATGNITTTGDIAVNGGDITSTATIFNFDIGNTGTLNFRDGTNTLAAISDQGTTGRLAVSGALQVGTLTTPTAYSRFVNSSATVTTHSLTTAQDLLIGGSTEINGILYLNGRTVASSNGTSTITFPSDPTAIDSYNTLTNGSWLVQNPTVGNPGIAALMVNQLKSGDIFTASASGTTKFTIANNGNVSINGTGTMLTVGGGTGKVDVGTVDPPYTINGQKYATYLSATVGVKEEMTGQAQTSEYIPGVGYRFVLDFNSQPVGSDLWLFGKTTNIKANLPRLSALLTPASPTNVWYEVDIENNRLLVYSARPTQVSYRLTAPRFNSEEYANTRGDDSSAVGFVINDADIAKTINEVINVQKISDYIIEGVKETGFVLKNSAGEIIDGVQSVGNFVAGNIRVGMVDSQLVIADSVQAAKATINNLTINNSLLSPFIATKLISPLPDGSDITVRLGSESSPSGKLAIQNFGGEEVASIDSAGNATFSGVVHSKNIDEIQTILGQVQTDQTLLEELTKSTSLNASGSANLDQLAVSNLFVTDQAAINSLSVSTTISVGNDLVFSSQIDQSTNQPINSLNTLSAPLKIQSLALAPIELMAGLVTIDTHGNVNIAGDLFVAGKITTPQLYAGIIDTADINATGSGTFNSVATTGLVIGAPDATVSGVITNGEINTSSTVGKAVIPAGTSEIVIKNPKVTDYTLVYVTLTSGTQNNVLYVKNKEQGQFVVGFTNPIDVDAAFNWWLVQVTQ